MTIKVTNRGNKQAEVMIYGPIGDDWLGVTASNFAKELNALGDVDEITVDINSEGGNVLEGMGIYNALVNHKARIVANISVALSTASWIAMSANVVKMAKNGLFMIHEPHLTAFNLDAAGLRKTADKLDLVREQIITSYSNARAIDKKTISDWMNAEKWFTGGEALEAGFVDELTGPVEISAHVDLSRFDHPPADILQNFETMAQSAQPKGDSSARAALTRMQTSLSARIK